MNETLTVDQRLEKLELIVAKLRLAGVMAAFVIVVFSCMGILSFLVKLKNGTFLALWGRNGSFTHLDEGAMTVSFEGEKWPRLRLDPERLELGLNGEPGHVDISARPSASLLLIGEKGASFRVSPGKELELSDGAVPEGWYFRVDQKPEGGGLLLSRRKSRFTAEADESGALRLALTDASGKVVWTAP